MTFVTLRCVAGSSRTRARVYACESRDRWGFVCQSLRVPRKPLLVLTATLVVVAGALGAAAVLHQARVAVEQDISRPVAVGDCVVVTTGAGDAVQTRRASCADDPSYTVGAMTDVSGSCPTTEYQHFAAPVADRATAGLCLVPNLVADHCYRLGMPIGVVEKAACSDSRTGSPDSGLLVQVTRRLDVHDQSACPAGGGSYAWPYPSPARTYCTATLF